MTGTTSISTVDESFHSEGGDTGQSAKTTGESFSASNSNSNVIGRGSNSTADVSQFIFLNPIWVRNEGVAKKVRHMLINNS
jgi:hypothetical protein